MRSRTHRRLGFRQKWLKGAHPQIAMAIPAVAGELPSQQPLGDTIYA